MSCQQRDAPNEAVDKIEVVQDLIRRVVFHPNGSICNFPVLCDQDRGRIYVP